MECVDKKAWEKNLVSEQLFPMQENYIKDDCMFLLPTDKYK